MELVVQALNDPSLLSTAVVHSLPCRIHRTGPAPVDRYFCVVEQDKDKTRLKASFRGRALAGKAVHVPDGYVGFVAREASAAVVTAVNSSKGKGKGKRHDDDDNDDDNDMQEGPQRMWTIAGGFEHFVCWDHDDEPTDENELVRLAEWVTVADALHAATTTTGGAGAAIHTFSATAKFPAPLDGQKHYIVVKKGPLSKTARSVQLLNPQSGLPSRYFLEEDDTVLLEAQRVEVGKGRSWFVGDSVQEDGRLVVLTPINPVFLMLDVLERARRAKQRRETAAEGVFVTLDQLLSDENGPGLRHLQNVAVLASELEKVCDIKTAHDLVLYRLNDAKTLAWLAACVQRVEQVLASGSLKTAALHPNAPLTEVALQAVLNYLPDAWAVKLGEEPAFAVAEVDPSAGKKRAASSEVDSSAPGAIPTFPTSPPSGDSKKRKTTPAKSPPPPPKGMKPMSSFFAPKASSNVQK